MISGSINLPHAAQRDHRFVNAAAPPINRPLTYKFQNVLVVALAECHRPLHKNRNMR
jgi:hypothetical protein